MSFQVGSDRELVSHGQLPCNQNLSFVMSSLSALDVSIQAQIINLMKDLQDQYGYTYLFISP